MKRIPTILLVALLLLTTAGAQTPEAATVDGVVIQKGSGAAVTGAQVLVRSVDLPDQQHTAITDAEGKFSIKGLTPSRYVLVVTRTGFAQGGSFVIAKAGDRIQDVRVELIRPGVISGRVFNENRVPKSHMEIEAVTFRTNDGRPSVSEAASAETDDRGEYRLTGLNPGDYYVIARGRPEEAVSAAPTFYPGVTDLKTATRLTVAAGAEARAGDFSLIQQKTYKITVRLVPPAGWSAGQQGSSFTLVPRNLSLPQSWTMFQFLNSSGNGRYSSYPVPPGVYDVYVRLDKNDNVARPNGFDASIYGHLTVNVIDKDVDAGNITPLPGISIRGRVTTRDTLPPDFSMNQVRISLRFPDGNYFTRQIAVAEDGTFALTNVARATIRIQADTLPPEFYLESARYGGRDVLDSGMTVDGEAPGPLPLEISIAGPGGIVEGYARKANGEPATDARAVLVPSPERRGRSANFFLSAGNDSGAFTFRGVRPGEYRLLVWEKALPDNYQDPDVLKDLEGYSVRVLVDRVPSNVGNVRAIAASR